MLSRLTVSPLALLTRYNISLLSALFLLILLLYPVPVPCVIFNTPSPFLLYPFLLSCNISYNHIYSSSITVYSLLLPCTRLSCILSCRSVSSFSVKLYIFRLPRTPCTIFSNQNTFLKGQYHVIFPLRFFSYFSWCS
jgi:hypothetical protein